jgi:RNase P/RNase MRP subunit p29
MYAPVAAAESAAAESAAAESATFEPGHAKPKKKAGSSKARSVQSIKLKDGNILKGQIIEQDKDTVTLKTSLGTIKIPKRSIAISSVILELDDNSVVVGKLIAESPDDYSVMTSFGVIKVKRSRVLRLTTRESQRQRSRANAQRVVGNSSGGSISRIGKPAGQFSHTIEPLIDVFFDPTGYTFKKGDLYLSGLSFAVGITDKTLISTNLVELSGLGSAFRDNYDGVSVNPNFELKHQLLLRRSAEREWALSTGFTYQMNALNGYTERTVDCTTNGSSADTPRRKNHGERRRYSYNNGCYNIRPGDTRMETEDIYGWRTQVYLANTISWLRGNGQGRISWHAGLRAELNNFNVKDYGEFFSYRLYNGFDVDLNRRIKLIGEVFYDPDFRNYMTDEKYWGADMGVMFAMSENFRFLLHTHPYFVGLYWRF